MACFLRRLRGLLRVVLNSGGGGREGGSKDASSLPYILGYLGLRPLEYAPIFNIRSLFVRSGQRYIGMSDFRLNNASARAQQ